MVWNTKKDPPPQKPKCELEFEKEYKALREKMSRRIVCRQEGEHYGFAVQDYFPILESWVKPYLLEEQLGVAILQRLQRVVEQQQEQEQSSEQPQKTFFLPESKDLLLPPDYNSSVTPPPSSAIIAEEVTRLRGEYWKQQDRLNLLDAVKPMNALPVQEQMSLRKHRDRHGRPFAWVLGQERCAASGGCCGRGCGCCEKALNRHLMPGRRNLAQEERAVAKVLGHCTVECRCCIEARGCYVPDSRLPAPAL